jgi:2-amino-4-hydroxy-6-hydroxymethyldihydropteridine diphosphokinase
LGLGSNLGNRELNLDRAIRYLTQLDLQIVKTSSIYSTEPVDEKNQDWFLNQVISAETTLEPEPLLIECLRIEERLGRKRRAPKGPRTIDIDILLYNRWVLEKENLSIPHPRLHLRRFVLVPLAEIAPQVIHPILLTPISALLESCPDRSQVVMYKRVC